MGSAGAAVQDQKRLRMGVPLRALTSEHEVSTDCKATLGIIEELVSADAISSKRMAHMDLLIPDGRLHTIAVRWKRAWRDQSLWGGGIKQLLVVEMVIGAMIGVLLGLATYDTRAYWWLLGLLPG